MIARLAFAVLVGVQELGDIGTSSRSTIGSPFGARENSELLFFFGGSVFLGIEQGEKFLLIARFLQAVDVGNPVFQPIVRHTQSVKVVTTLDCTRSHR